MKLNRRVSAVVLSQAEIETLRMPEKVKEVFILLGNEKDIGIKGGHAKLLFQVLLRQWEEIKGRRNCRVQGYNSAPFDLDITLACKNMSDKSLVEIQEQRVNPLVEKLQGIVELKETNIEAVQGNLKDKEVIKRDIEGQDMTINEIVAVPNNGLWTLSSTDMCRQDIINGAGILTPNGQGTIRWHGGAMMASQKGITRLLQAYVESKVMSIYLPQRWIDINNEEVQRLFKKDLKFRENLGYYGYLMCQRYLKNRTLQEKLMQILTALKITDISDFAEFYNEQRNAAELFNGNFRYNSNLSFLENQKRIKTDKQRREKSKQERRNRMHECEHKQVKTSICDGCQWKCAVWKCESCNLTAIKPWHSEFFKGDSRELLCNKNLIENNLYWDKQGFIYNR